MAHKQCRINEEKSLQRRRVILRKRRERLSAACEQGDLLACKTLQELNQAEEYRAQHRYRNEHHLSK